MVPYFHTGGADSLLFGSWKPLSSDAIAGAAVIIFFLAVLERLVNGIRGRLEGYWTSRALHRSLEHMIQEDAASCAKVEVPSLSEESKGTPAPRKRVTPPFIPSHDLPRGLIYMVQATLFYALMLSAMTFQVGYFIAIIAGLGVGEAIFGRWTLVTH